MAKKNYLAGQLDNIEFVVIFTKYQDKWVYCWHKKRESYEHPGGHVEKGETPLAAAKRELYEETGITDCDIMPLWDYEFIWDNGMGQNNGRVYIALVHSLGEMPESEMDRIELFDTVPEKYTYSVEEEEGDIRIIEKMLRAYRE
ncbi:MAG: NUDIX domain-containing protein [Lachnospiraceae bacterium]